MNIDLESARTACKIVHDEIRQAENELNAARRNLRLMRDDVNETTDIDSAVETIRQAEIRIELMNGKVNLLRRKLAAAELALFGEEAADYRRRLDELKTARTNEIRAVLKTIGHLFDKPVEIAEQSKQIRKIDSELFSLRQQSDASEQRLVLARGAELQKKQLGEK